MQTTGIQRELYAYIGNGDEKLLKLMLALAKDYVGDETTSPAKTSKFWIDTGKNA